MSLLGGSPLAGAAGAARADVSLRAPLPDCAETVPDCGGTPEDAVFSWLQE